MAHIQNFEHKKPQSLVGKLLRIVALKLSEIFWNSQFSFEYNFSSSKANFFYTLFVELLFGAFTGVQKCGGSVRQIIYIHNNSYKTSWNKVLNMLSCLKWNRKEGEIVVFELEDKWISIEEAADYLGVNKDTIRNWIKKEDSEIPACKIGKQWKFKRSELDAWVKSGKSSI